MAGLPRGTGEGGRGHGMQSFKLDARRESPGGQCNGVSWITLYTRGDSPILLACTRVRVPDEVRGGMPRGPVCRRSTRDRSCRVLLLLSRLPYQQWMAWRDTPLSRVGERVASTGIARTGGTSPGKRDSLEGFKSLPRFSIHDTRRTPVVGTAVKYQRCHPSRGSTR
jgi:hypothetical protein